MADRFDYIENILDQERTHQNVNINCKIYCRKAW